MMGIAPLGRVAIGQLITLLDLSTGFVHVSDYVLDHGLAALASLADTVCLCLYDPPTYVEAASTFALASYPVSIAAPGPGSPNGRQVTVPGGSGTASATGSAAKWALVSQANGMLLANGNMSAPAPMVRGNIFTLGSFALELASQ